MAHAFVSIWESVFHPDESSTKGCMVTSDKLVQTELGVVQCDANGGCDGRGRGQKRGNRGIEGNATHSLANQAYLCYTRFLAIAHRSLALSLTPPFSFSFPSDCPSCFQSLPLHDCTTERFHLSQKNLRDYENA